MPATIERPLRDGDVIEVVMFDEDLSPRDRLHIRRVRVQNLTTRGSNVRFTGVNLQGKYPQAYELPKAPIEEAVREGRYRGWLHAPEGEGEE